MTGTLRRRATSWHGRLSNPGPAREREQGAGAGNASRPATRVHGVCYSAAAYCCAQRSIASMARDAVRLSVQPSTGCADQLGQGAVRAPRRGRAGRSRPVYAPGSPPAVARPRPHRGSAGAVDARVQDRSTLTADALDGHAAVADGTLAAGGLPPRRADAVCRCAARQGRAAGSGPARRRRAGCGPRVHGDPRLWSVVLPECEQGLGARQPDARDVRRLPSIRFGIRSRRGFGGRDRTWRIFRTCTGTRIPRRR